MTSLFQTPMNFARRPLSDGLVGPVLPRNAGHHVSERDFLPTRAHGNFLQATNDPSQQQLRSPNFSIGESTASGGSVRPTHAPTTGEVPPTLTKMSPTKSKTKGTSHKDQRLSSYKTSRRLEQCRINQRRYRERKRAFKLNVVQQIEQLRQEIESCNHRRQEIAFAGRNNRSPWRVVADVFRLLENSFADPWSSINDTATLEKSFALDVTMGDLDGVNELMGQIQRYSQSFGNPKIHLKRVEATAAGIVTASAELNFTVSDFTLRTIFPHLQTVSKSKYDTLWLASDRLIGQTLDCNCSVTLYFDEESGRVGRMEISIDWVNAFLQVLGNIEDVSKVLSGALITPDCIIGDISTSCRGSK